MMLGEVVLSSGTHQHRRGGGAHNRGTDAPEVRPRTAFLASSRVALKLLVQGLHLEK